MGLSGHECVLVKKDISDIEKIKDLKSIDDRFFKLNIVKKYLEEEKKELLAEGKDYVSNASTSK